MFTGAKLARLCKSNCFSISAKRFNFTVPPSYKPDTHVKKLPFLTSLAWWWNSFKPNRLQTLQNELIEHMISSSKSENVDIRWENKKIDISKSHGPGTVINEICIEVKNNATKPTKHVVFVHGYGAALGCFARNFQMINLLKDMNYNYKVHFLDNISFGLSSNPDLLKLSRKIPKVVDFKMVDPEKPTDPKKLYNKYYKLVESYSMDALEFGDYKNKFTPILKDLEKYYTSAIDQWRELSGIQKIDYLVGHSYGGHWSGSYSVRYPENLKSLILLSPVAVERHFQAVTNPGIPSKTVGDDLIPSLDPTSYNFLSRWPILSKKHLFNWYWLQPILPKALKFLGPYGVSTYYNMWYSKLFKINRLISKRGGAHKYFKNSNDLVYGTNKEIHLLIEYLYNNMSKSSVSDVYIKYLLTPSTVGKWPLYDKFLDHLKRGKLQKIILIYT